MTTIRRSRHSFARKIIVAAMLVTTADIFFYWGGFGAVLGVFALAWVASLAWVHPQLRRHPGPRIALGSAILFSMILIDDPSFLAVVLCMIAIGTAALLPRHVYDDAVRWFLRLAAFGLIGVVRPFADARRIVILPSNDGVTLRNVAAALAPALIGGAIFIALFASANPLLARALAFVRLPGNWSVIAHLIFWSFMLVILWPTLRPRSIRLGSSWEAIPCNIRELPVGTLVLTLATFNALFAIENLLDIVFLWSNAPLPDGVTLADYAHRGAYTLIATALLAALFVLIALRPGGRAAEDKRVRRLVVLWIAQNVLLVASSALRLFDYIQAYSMTVLRLSALAWMALVAVGLILVCWRLVTGRSTSWLINANALAAALVLLIASVVDLGAVAASWNVRYAWDASDLDLCYLNRLGSAALLPLIELERRAGTAEIRDRATYLRNQAVNDLRSRQDDWRNWTWRGARRLAHAQTLLGPSPRKPIAAPYGRACDGAIYPPPEPEPEPSQQEPLTKGVRQ